LCQHRGVLLTGRIHRSRSRDAPHESAAAKKTPCPNRMQLGRFSGRRIASWRWHWNQLRKHRNRSNSREAKTHRTNPPANAVSPQWQSKARELRECDQAHSVQSESCRQLTLMLQADIGRVNARAGEERRIVPQRDEKILILVPGVIVGVTLRPSLSVFSTEDPA
jgi:hypothetical protein